MQIDTRTKSVLDQLRQRFEAIYGERLVRLVLYGSRARGDADTESDYDILVVLKSPLLPSEERSRMRDEVTEISLNNDAIVACVFISEDSFESEQSPLLINARREGVAL